MNIEIGATILIKAASGACKRTKNRIREHGSEGFVIKDFTPSSWLFDGAPAINVKPAGKGDGWFGWLPLPEIEEQS